MSTRLLGRASVAWLAGMGRRAPLGWISRPRLLAQLVAGLATTTYAGGRKPDDVIMATREAQVQPSALHNTKQLVATRAAPFIAHSLHLWHRRNLLFGVRIGTVGRTTSAAKRAKLLREVLGVVEDHPTPRGTREPGSAVPAEIRKGLRAVLTDIRSPWIEGSDT